MRPDAGLGLRKSLLGGLARGCGLATHGGLAGVRAGNPHRFRAGVSGGLAPPARFETRCSYEAEGFQGGLAGGAGWHPRRLRA